MNEMSTLVEDPGLDAQLELAEIKRKSKDKPKRGHMNFIELLTAVDFRTGYIMARTKGEYGEHYYSFREMDGNLWFCAGTPTGRQVNGNNEFIWTKCALPSERDRKKRDWIVMQDENGKVPEL